MLANKKSKVILPSVAQLAEQRPFKAKVVGSWPTGGILKFVHSPRSSEVEQRPFKAKVAVPNTAGGTILLIFSIFIVL